MVETNGLENRRTETFRGFESHPLGVYITELRLHYEQVNDDTSIYSSDFRM